MEKLLSLPYFKKAILFAVADGLLVTISVLIAFWLRFDGKIPAEYGARLWLYIAILAGLNLFFIWRKRLYAFTWAFIGLQDLTRLVQALTYASATFALVMFLDFGTTNSFAGFPRSVILISYFLNLLFIGSLRISKRLWTEIIERGVVQEGAVNTLIIGAGKEGEKLIRDLRSAESRRYNLVGLLDENPEKQKTLIHGVPVIGKLDEFPKLAEEYKIQNAIIALPAGENENIKKAVRYARQSGIHNVKIIPPFSELLEKKIAFETLKDISIEDLLGRETAKIETEAIKNFLRDKKVLVTGAAGSIGSELCRQIIQFHPAALTVFDFNESGVFDLENELRVSAPEQNLWAVVGNITNRGKVEAVFQKARPEVIFHAAAYKHVPLMEYFPEEAVETNVFGTLILAETAVKHGVKNFVLISTDKAVKPNSAMGKTKRAAEIILKSLNGKSETKFVSVRFGNVLASRGSVVPLFQEQIRRRAALTITHPEMKRYFMTIPEAALLVMEAGAVGQGGEIFILDMGEPVKIIDMAHEMIKLSGLEPDKDIPIVFTGVRPGEKLFEELLSEEEKKAGATKWEKIFISKTEKNPDYQEVKEKLGELEKDHSKLDEFITLA